LNSSVKVKEEIHGEAIKFGDFKSINSGKKLNCNFNVKPSKVKFVKRRVMNE